VIAGLPGEESFAYHEPFDEPYQRSHRRSNNARANSFS
jgi:hypothetical protein